METGSNMTWDWISKKEARQMENVWAMEDAREHRRKIEWRQEMKPMTFTTTVTKMKFPSETTAYKYDMSKIKSEMVTDVVLDDEKDMTDERRDPGPEDQETRSPSERVGGRGQGTEEGSAGLAGGPTRMESTKSSTTREGDG